MDQQQLEQPVQGSCGEEEGFWFFFRMRARVRVRLEREEDE